MRMSKALEEIGAVPGAATAEEKAALDRDGYVVVPDVLTPDQTKRMAARLKKLATIEGDEAGKDFQVEKGTVRLGSLVNKGPEFDVCFLHPKALALVSHILGDNFGLSSITSRSAKPGEGEQGYHRDSNHPAVNALWLISDFTPHNGSTRLIPGSHLTGKGQDNVPADPMARHPDETYVIAPAGSLVVINGNLVHSGTRNCSDHDRHLISAFWLPRGLYQPESQRVLTREAYERLSEAARYIIDHEYHEEAMAR